MSSKYLSIHLSAPIIIFAFDVLLNIYLLSLVWVTTEGRRKKSNTLWYLKEVSDRSENVVLFGEVGDVFE